MFSPRPWGWSSSMKIAIGPAVVFPTPVGMVRVGGALTVMQDCFPHARGDGPGRSCRNDPQPQFSPRPWGWSVRRSTTSRHLSVFPTPVGMVRRPGSNHPACRGFPHARGDGPLDMFNVLSAPVFSPRPWGWSANGTWITSSHYVFPTPVGMVRVGFAETASSFGFPHARGDGPIWTAARAQRIMFSPRPWGWSRHCHLGKRRGPVFPTPVGMVR